MPRRRRIRRRLFWMPERPPQALQEHPLQDRELQELAALHQASFTTPRPWSAAEIASFLTLPHAFLIRRPLGFLIGTAIAGEAELVTVAVAPEARRQGLGRALLEGFLDAAHARGAAMAFLEVSAENQGAIALYESAGFARTGLRRGYYATPTGSKIDAILMACALN